jgi:XTP/dITP diphosphohydrolase
VTRHRPAAGRDGTELPTVVLATRSAGKERELAALVEDAGVCWRTLAACGLPEDAAAEAAIECHATFADNALAKGRWFAGRLARAGWPSAWLLAEDSGLCVEALGGAPGVQSKRWGGLGSETGAALDTANIGRLQAALAAAGALDEASRAAHYECVAVLLRPDGQWWSATGRTSGRILAAPRGAGGFGYDPVFWSDELAASFGEVSAVAKAAVSHRGRAIRALLGSPAVAGALSWRGGGPAR